MICNVVAFFLLGTRIPSSSSLIFINLEGGGSLGSSLSGNIGGVVGGVSGSDPLKYSSSSCSPSKSALPLFPVVERGMRWEWESNLDKIFEKVGT